MNRKVLALTTLLVSIFALAAPTVFAPMAFGQGDGIHIVSQEVESNFPNDITFRVIATSPDPIEEIRVFLKALGSDRSTYAYLDIETGTEVSGEYVMPTGMGTVHKPPGTVVRYSYEIRDAGGRVHRTEDQDFLYLDDSVEWKEVSEGLLTVFYYGDFVEKRAQTVLEAVELTMENMGRVLGIEPEEPVNVVAYSNYRDMSRALPFRSQAVREELQTQGQAYPIERVLLVLASESDVTGTASHEFTHILVAEAAGKGYVRVPAWLNEGLAEYGNIDQTPFYDRALAYAIYTRRLKPLWYLDEFSGEPDDIIMAYGQGKSAVQYLIDFHGERKMAELMSAFARGLSTDDSLMATYGFDQYGLDSQWRQALGIQPLPPPVDFTSPSPGPAPGSDATPVPTPQVEPTPAAADEPTPQAGAPSDRPAGTARSCGRGSSGSGGVPLDIAMLALLGGPFLALNLKWGLGRNRGGLGLVRRVTRGLRRPRDR